MRLRDSICMNFYYIVAVIWLKLMQFQFNTLILRY